MDRHGISLVLSAVVIIIIVQVQANPSVLILSQNLEQLVTSTTLQWQPYNPNDKAILNNAVIAAYQTVDETKLNDDGTESLNAVQKPIYICRTTINGVLVSGQLRPRRPVCVASLYKKAGEYNKFDVLINTEGNARLSWVNKDKYTILSQGAVTSSDIALTTYVARRVAKNHNKDGSVTHFVGKFNPSENLGIFTLVDQNNKEIEFEEGEILVETEPVGYEFKSIRFLRYGSRYLRKRQILGTATLKNEEPGRQKVVSVISYNYNYSLSWGRGHGLLTGLPFTVNLPNTTQIKGTWGIVQTGERELLHEIEQYLDSGTAVNVTLVGNLTEAYEPYKATVVSFYKDNTQRETSIAENKKEYSIRDVKAEFSPVYFINNNSYVPTTTTTTTTTTTSTTTTTTRTTSTTQEVAPIAPPPEISVRSEVEGLQSENTSKNPKLIDNNNINDEEGAQSLKKKNTNHAAGINNPSSAVLILLGVFYLFLT